MIKKVVNGQRLTAFHRTLSSAGVQRESEQEKRGGRASHWRPFPLGASLVLQKTLEENIKVIFCRGYNCFALVSL